ncbi:hypothetical protein BOTBODRAFT_176407 [Botryobasidium botryosum FD-172 SS1]|uniref:Uncharacterized protein n=1 Tax=Botryobasidium botryosum (strain FD-172 SS1) TaxID=930990 RepID=A0A067MKR4_BOTB1|nr:hypothetical protein BOTBODRAFT_176407 [Botryobasidium botryosum FD-172 SS1]
MVAMRPFAEEPWTREAKIVVAFDIGTTQAAVSFAHLYPGGAQVLHRVIQWPGQQSQGGEAKIPSLIWYDDFGQARAFGAEARSSEVLDQAEDNGWHLAKHFKLHLHPPAMRTQQRINVDPLPPRVTVDQIYADFLGYLFSQTKRFFKERILDGSNTWETLASTIEFVIAHPNGWDIGEQGILRHAAVAANLVPSIYAAQERVHFVSEAEASVHFVLVHADLDKRLKVSDNFIVCDAGGSTVDTTLYTVDETAPLIRLKERRASACVQAGAIFVNQSVEEYMKSAFERAGLDQETITEYTTEALESFESDAKRTFRHEEEDKIINVGGRRFTSTELNVRRGSMTMKGSQIQTFFDPWVNKAIESVNSQIEGHPVQHILLVGGFGESPYLRQKLAASTGSRGIKITLADDSTSKAVADGAVIWFIRHAVTARATRYAFGTDILVNVEPIQGPKIGRRVLQTPSGPYFDGGWREMVPKGRVLENSDEIIREFSTCYTTSTPYLGTFSSTIYAYDGADPRPVFIDDRYGNMNPGFRTVCDVEADLSGLVGALTRGVGPTGSYWSMSYSIALKFGGTELRASLVWQERGITRRGLASIIPPSQI